MKIKKYTYIFYLFDINKLTLFIKSISGGSLLIFCSAFNSGSSTNCQSIISIRISFTSSTEAVISSLKFWFSVSIASSILVRLPSFCILIAGAIINLTNIYHLFQNLNSIIIKIKDYRSKFVRYFFLQFQGCTKFPGLSFVYFPSS